VRRQSNPDAVAGAHLVEWAGWQHGRADPGPSTPWRSDSGRRTPGWPT